jgi:plasmid stabilization system protein ParE
MNLHILWTEEAKETFESVVSFIEYKWGFNSAKKFIAKSNRIIASISAHPYIFKATYPKSLRKAVITKQTSLFYEVHESYIALIYFGTTDKSQ